MKRTVDARSSVAEMLSQMEQEGMSSDERVARALAQAKQVRPSWHSELPVCRAGIHVVSCPSAELAQ